MTREEIKDQVLQNLRDRQPTASEVRVQPDPFGGWRVSVISDAFAGLNSQERRVLALSHLDDTEIQFSEFLTTEERDWSGVLIKDSDLRDLPTWTDALSRTVERETSSTAVLVPSQLETDLPKPIRVTFYSVKGGVGRSTSLVYSGRILARKGYKVLCVDLDLEAPGLASLFGVQDQVQEWQGTLNLLVNLDRGEKVDISKHLIRVDESDELYCLPAGTASPEYARQLQFVNPSAWYTEEANPFRKLIDGLGTDLSFTPDVILFDARTGISEISAPLLFDIADLAIIVFFPHPQAQAATREVVRALLASKTKRQVAAGRLTPEPRFIVSPVPSSRIPEVVNRYRHRSAEWISDWLSSSLPDADELAESLADGVHFVPYTEEIATSDSTNCNGNVWRAYEPVAEWIERFLPTESELATPLLTADKTTILEQLNFSAGTAEHQHDFGSTFVEVGTTRRALDPLVPLVLGRKGVGKTAVFRRLLEARDCSPVPITAPAPLRGDRPWVLTADGFAEAEALLRRCGAQWRHLWQMLIVLACRYTLHLNDNAEDFGSIDISRRPDGSIQLLELVERMLAEPRGNLTANDWLDRIDKVATSRIILLFDGLDTGFGNSAEERERRRAALQGLLELMIDRGERPNLKFKVLLREDIWRTLRFENKSHFYGRSITLDWREQTAFYKIVLKQALRSPAFQNLIQKTSPIIDFDRLADWDDQQVATAWNVLVGDRMKGEKTTFTRNWVWNRLADANGDHSPRYLLQLFREVAAWENNQQARNPYERSVLRPRALIETLPAVSRQALDALLEEFPELAPLLYALTSIGRTPVVSEELSIHGDLLSLAREVGLLGVYEGTEEQVERYRVPEIYRYALEMTRKGQA